MQRVMAIIRAVMAAVVVATATAGRWIKRAGEWVYERLPSPGGVPVPAPQVQEPENASRGDEDALACIRAAAASIAAGKVPDPTISGRIDSDVVRWLITCTDDALRKVVRAENNELRAHMQGRLSLKGVLAFDREAVAQIERGKMERLDLGIDVDLGQCVVPDVAPA